ncbi:hypothetical protein DACRYDRAFT_25116 [Dacryopinax primogenitus]|uniref:DH domain-containing protein n=1 Tax=Dacryopinax primogenitus (strain DJM 731) TaxID=1858805 RepID=M5FNE9_DACPD|nr:uncharacterized protein DACRYDRAFT_25116 [Dacryopinax primogenitus]EJT97325.1 hypothetical protein DACRYDRAFT_25116 [Dacryopinax primogenitus]
MAASIRKKSVQGGAPILDSIASTMNGSAASTPMSAGPSAAGPLSAPFIMNTLLNRGASSSSSLYQQCSNLRARLTRLSGFSPFFTIAATSPLSAHPRNSTFDGQFANQPKRDSSNPVNQLWDLFRLGLPLVYIWNLEPPYGSEPITSVDGNPEALESEKFNLNEAKKAILFFSMGITKLSKTGQWKGPPGFTVSDLQGEDTNGFVKVVHAVSHLLDLLPPTILPPAEAEPSASASGASDALRAALPASGQPSAGPSDEHERSRKHVINELLATERKYVQDLENLHDYATALGRQKILTQDTIHEIFSSLRHILDQQRRFLIEVEKTAELPDAEQDWGVVFTSAQTLFETYIPYCANFSRAGEIVLSEMDQLIQLPDAKIDARSELQAFLIKPVQRICRYPLLLKDLLKATPPSNPHHQSVSDGLQAAVTYAEHVNESQRKYENQQTVRALRRRVEDWKGHHLDNFGDLVLDEIFMVTKGDQDREYHVFLFEKIILCCKEQPTNPNGPQDGKKKNALTGKNNSLLRKGAGTPGPPPPPPPKNARTTPLSLKGRIYLSNIIRASADPPQTGGSAYGAYSTAYPLIITWTDVGNTQEFLILRCRSEEQLRQWEGAISRLITAQREKRDVRSRGASISTSHAPIHERGFSVGADARPPTIPAPGGHPYMHQQRPTRAFPPPSSSQAPDFSDRDSDTMTAQPRRRDHAASASVRGQEPPFVMPQRARTEGTNGPTNTAWREQYPYGVPPPMPRMMSNMSTQSAQSEASFGNAPASPMSTNGQLPPSRPANGTSNRPPSQSKMRTVQNFASASSPDVPAVMNVVPPRKSSAMRLDSESTGNRSRSVSTPAPYVPQQIRALPPVPVPPLAISTGNQKRESGSSQSTAEEGTDDSDSPTFPYQSPDTPFGSNDSSLLATANAQPPMPNMQYIRPQPPLPTQSAQVVPMAAVSPPLRATRSQVFSSRSNSPVTQNLPPLPSPEVPTINKPIMVKVSFRSDLFALTVQRNIGHQELMSKLRRKIELCGGESLGPLRIKYMDEEGDLVSLGGPDDLAMAMEVAGQTHQIKLFVQH